MSILCTLCHTFSHPPGLPSCAVCRTILRIQWYVKGRLGAENFGPVLSALREAAGVVQDCAENRVVRLAGLPPAPDLELPPGAEPAAEGGENREVNAKPAEAEKEDTEEAQPKKKREGRKVKKVAKGSKDKKEKKEKASSSRRAAEEDEKSEERPRERREVRDKATTRRTEVDDKREPLSEDDKDEEEGEPEDPQLALDEYVSKHPREFSLGSLPIRGSVSSHFERTSGSARPAEPDHPPRSHDDRLRPVVRERSRSRRRGTKGAGHRERGRERKNWPQGQWNQKRPQWPPKRR